MRRTVLSAAFVVGMSGVFVGRALAQPMDDMCAPPKLKTDKWQARSEVGGMTILVPPGFTAGGHSGYQETQDSHFYMSGEHRSIAVGSGRSPAFVIHVSDIQESGECDAVIEGRHVTITVYRWSVIDTPLSASGEAGPHFAAVARYYAAAGSRELYVAFMSNSPSDLKFYRQLFWTVSFGDGSSTTAAIAHAPAPADAPTPAATPAQPAQATAEPPITSTLVIGKVCSTATAPANLPAASVVVDSAVVGSLLAGAAPIPSGFEVMRLQFDANGELAGMNVSQSDLPEASQREIASVVGTNLKPHTSKEPPSIYLRIDSTGNALRYSVVPPPSC